MNYSIRAKLLLITGTAFFLMAAGVIAVSSYMVKNITLEAGRIVDAGVDDFYKEKLRSIIAEIDRGYAASQESGKESGQKDVLSEDAAKAAVLKSLRVYHFDKAEGRDKLIYPFITDEKGVMVLHPVLPAGDRSIANADFIQHSIRNDKGMLPYTYQNEAKILYFQKFAPWKWSVHFAVPTKIKEAEVVKMSDLLSSLRNNLVIMVMILAVIAMVCLGAYITWKIVRPINEVIVGLNMGSDHVVGAAGQVAETNQSIAQGASEQAAAIEETSSACEEMLSMTKQNSDNANHANALMDTTNQVVHHANGSMTDLTKAMKEISAASDETAKIIKTIDEVAFQTNLLALNAAVEAARAGEAGAGFAVVADEVRNLAMRAADAAKNTATLIETTVNKVKDGSGLVSRTAEAFGQVTGNAAKVKELVAEIAAASNEQAQGIEQINKAVAEMDQVVQANAAHAEEGAGASEELSGQATDMKAKIMDLVHLVSGQGGSEPQKQLASGTGPKLSKIPLHAVKKGSVGTALARVNPRRNKPTVVHPEEVIPLDDKDFKSF